MNEIETDRILEASKIDEPLPALTRGLTPALTSGLRPHDLRGDILVPESSAPAAAGPLWLRLAYTLEFLIALMTSMSLWSEIGGQGHLDLMPWHIKLVCIVGLAWCCVRFTASMVERQELWTRRMIGWLAGILLFCIAMGGITYYYHLHEEPADGDDDTSTARLSVPVSTSISR